MLPQLSYDHVQDLAPGYGRLHLTGELLDVTRAADDSTSFNGVPYDFGLAGGKEHLMLEGGWENQFILPGGVAATPYLAGAVSTSRTMMAAAPMPGRQRRHRRLTCSRRRRSPRSMCAGR